jgi:flagellar assembly protein FliH
MLDESNVISVDVMDEVLLRLKQEEEEKRLSEEEAKHKSEQILAFAESEAQRLKDEALADAEKEAAVIISKANAESAKIKKEAYQEAYENGLSKGEEEANILIKDAEQIKADAYIEKNKILNSAEPEAVELISDVIKKLIGDIYEVNPGVIMFLIRQGLAQVAAAGDITIHVSRQDYDELIPNKEEILALAEAGTKIDILRDVSLNRSDCVIETRFGNIDCSLNRQYEALKENLYYICKNRFAENDGM